jgi:anionic cell wall polymer biosynthesis LytR-Cps2A-Psr (LCP) family protein
VSAEKTPGEGARTPLARHAVRGERHPFLRVLSIVGVVLAVFAVSAAGVAAYAVWDAFSAVGENSVDLAGEELPPSIGEIEGGVNLLLVGSDSCEGQDVALFPRCADPDDAPGERNDVTMLVHISDQPRRITVVSFPRDMLVPIPACPDGAGGS